MKAVEKVNKLIDKAEKRRAKLTEKVAALKEEVNFLYQAQQDDFNEAILEDKEVNKKITRDLEKAREELANATYLLGQIDHVVKNELQKAKEAVDEQRNQYIAEKGLEFRKQFDKMNKLKIAYLESIIEFSEMKKEFILDFNQTFLKVSHRVGLRRIDPRDHFSLSLNQRYQTSDFYSPLVYNDELSDALYGKLSYLTDKNRDKFSK